MGVSTMLKGAEGTKQQTKWDRFNDAAPTLIAKWIREGYITGYEVVNYVPGKMNVFFILIDEDACPTERQREMSIEFNALWQSFGITVDDMAYDNQMGLRPVTSQEHLNTLKECIKGWADIV